MGEGREELESGVYGFYGEKVWYVQILVVGGEEIRERKGQVLICGGGGGWNVVDIVIEKGW